MDRLQETVAVVAGDGVEVRVEAVDVDVNFAGVGGGDDLYVVGSELGNLLDQQEEVRVRGNHD